jgi:hypothetical protein
MSDMSRESAPPGGDPLDLTGEIGTEDDVLPGPPGGVEVAEESGEDLPSPETGSVSDAEPSPEPGATLDPPGRQMEVDPDAAADPIDQADTEAMRPPGIGGSDSGSDPMPDIAGTTP